MVSIEGKSLKISFRQIVVTHGPWIYLDYADAPMVSTQRDRSCFPFCPDLNAYIDARLGNTLSKAECALF